MNTLNREALVQLEKDTSADIVPVILRRFLEELEQRCTGIREALEETGGAERVGLEAHSIKSAAKTFGLETLAKHALELESAAASEEPLSLRELSECLFVAAGDARSALEQFLAQSD